jgi:hypothetical protein
MWRQRILFIAVFFLLNCASTALNQGPGIDAEIRLAAFQYLVSRFYKPDSASRPLCFGDYDADYPNPARSTTEILIPS